MAKKTSLLSEVPSFESFIENTPELKEDKVKGHRDGFVRIAFEVTPEERKALREIALKNDTTIRGIMLSHIQQLVSEHQK